MIASYRFATDERQKTEWHSPRLHETPVETTAENRDGAVEYLCFTYRHPLYLYLRHLGYSPDDSQDLLQGFILRVIQKNVLDGERMAAAQLRTFLLVCLNNYLHNEWDKRRAVHRGSRCVTLSLEAMACSGGSSSSFQPAWSGVPNREYERNLALGFLARSMEQLRDEFVAAGRCGLFESLEPHLFADKTRVHYAELARKFEMNQPALRMTVRRMRRRLSELFSLEVRHSGVPADEVDTEVRHLLSCLSP